MVKLDSIGKDFADCLKTEKLKGMYPLRQQGVGSPTTRADFAVYPYLERLEHCIDEISLSPPMPMKLVVTEGTVKGSHVR